MIESLGEARATNEPKRSACGAPDYTVWRPTGHGPMTIGYVEAKDIGVPLGVEEQSDQLARYRSALDNLILTDYLEFRWYAGGEHKRTAVLATRSGDDLVFATGGQEAVEELLRDFLAKKPAEIKSPPELARRMARLTHLIRDVIVEAFRDDAETRTTHDLRDAFAEVLIPEISVPEFADMFAQTIAYGLFAARANHMGSEPFRRKDAAAEIPKTNPFLRRLFATITGPDLDDEPFAGLVDDLAQLLAHTDMDAVLADFGTRTRRKDPVVHFYETFLAAYDPLLREARGVYYTPGPVVSYIVRSVDHLLRADFGCSDGLADRDEVSYTRVSEQQEKETATSPRVLILDPACGTGTFLYAVIDHIREQFRSKDDAGRWSAYVHDQLLPRLLGFELLMAPYAVAHLKLGMQLAAQDLPEEERSDWAYDFSGGERLGVYLTNTLEEALQRSEVLLGSYISEEANAAAEIKQDRPIYVVLGNPPYSGHSANRGDWITDLVYDYKRGVPGMDKPAQAKWLQDDYVKFLRFGQWRIERTGAGILAFITNHAYLDNPTFRGMREQLMQTFTDIYVLDIHGNQKRKETTPDGERDRNVFDIQQGVAISLFVKRPDGESPAQVHHADLWSSDREEKYTWLSEFDVATTDWSELAPESPEFSFTPRDEAMWAEYQQAVGIDDAMSANGDPAPGIVTTQDEFAISWTRDEAIEKVERFLATESEKEARSLWKLCSTTQWNYKRAKRELADGQWRDEVHQILYRPFDVRWTVFDPNVAVHRRLRAMRHLVSRKNIALISARSNRSPTPDHFFCSRFITEAKTGEATTQSYTFPLYLYPNEENGSLFGEHEQSPWAEGEGGRHPNFDEDFIELCQERLGQQFVPDGRGDLASTFGPEDVFAYAYAVFYSQTYRDRYAAFLKTDFPRLPITTNGDLFRTLVAKGDELISLHTLESPLVTVSTTHYPVKGSDKVEQIPRYLAPGEYDPLTGDELTEGRVYISKDNRRTKQQGQYIAGVSPDVWEFTIGGYQVCEKWLKDRRGRTLSDADLTHYSKIVAAINETSRVMDEIDTVIRDWPIP